MNDTNSSNCPLCDKHCPLDEPECPKGEEFARSGSTYSAEPVYEHDNAEKSQDEKLLQRFRDCAHFLRHRTDGKGSQRRVLSIINKRDDITQRKLMDIVGVRAGSLSELLGKLEGKGFIERRRNNQDKRNIDIDLTESGRTMLGEMQEHHDSSVSDLFSALSDDEKEQLLSLLEKLLKSWDWADKKPEKDVHKHKHGYGHDHGHLHPHGKQSHKNLHHDGRRGHKKGKRGRQY